ncbi:MAG: hypothetical protein OEW19_17585 [Acidobacteriota bacterium]|nr:hypothetical protein [Acidobacteriota bacterium]
MSSSSIVGSFCSAKAQTSTGAHDVRAQYPRHVPLNEVVSSGRREADTIGPAAPAEYAL